MIGSYLTGHQKHVGDDDEKGWWAVVVVMVVLVMVLILKLVPWSYDCNHCYLSRGPVTWVSGCHYNKNNDSYYHYYYYYYYNNKYNIPLVPVFLLDRLVGEDPSDAFEGVIGVKAWVIVVAWPTNEAIISSVVLRGLGDFAGVVEGVAGVP